MAAIQAKPPAARMTLSHCFCPLRLPAGRKYLVGSLDCHEPLGSSSIKFRLLHLKFQDSTKNALRLRAALSLVPTFDQDLSGLVDPTRIVSTFVLHAATVAVVSSEHMI